MKLLVFIALFALMLSVVIGHGCDGGHAKNEAKDHDDAHGDHDDANDEMTCPEGEVAVMGYGTKMICVACKDQMDSCKSYAKYCTDKRFKKYLHKNCPVSCGLC